MREVNVTAFRQNLQSYLSMVERGERVRVTHRGRAIAELSPPAPLPSEAEAARARLRGSVVRDISPTDSFLGEDDWEMAR